MAITGPLKFETRPSFLLNFGMANWRKSTWEQVLSVYLCRLLTGVKLEKAGGQCQNGNRTI